MQDRAQKADALRYSVAKRWFPQLELDVSTYITIAKTPTNITDIDVYASVPDDFVGFRTIIFDCKTRKGESPISRAMWQVGLMERLNADRGVCILRVPKIEPDHRYTAAQLRVTLLAESEFDAYAAATSADYSSPLGAIAEIDRWDHFFGIGARFRRLEPAIKFSRSGYWMSETEAEACTRTIFLASKLRPELDPEKPEHLAIVADLAALLMHALARIVINIFGAYLQPGNQADLSRALLYYLYGGKSSYDHLNRVKRMLVESARLTDSRTTVAAAVTAGIQTVTQATLQKHIPIADPKVRDGGDDEAPDGAHVRRSRGVAGQASDSGAKDLRLPEWDRFVELVRQLLDAPLQVGHAPLILREIAWAALDAGTGKSDGITAFARTLAASSPQGARFAVLALGYLLRAARLPREFNDVITGRLLAAQTKL